MNSPPISDEVCLLALPQIDRGRFQRESTCLSMPVMVSHPPARVDVLSTGLTVLLESFGLWVSGRGISVRVTHPQWPVLSQDAYCTMSHTSPEAVPLVACRSQQPATGKMKPLPHSSPGRFQLEPPCSSGPKVGWAGMPCGPCVDRWKEPAPVILHTILISCLGWMGISAKNKAQSCTPVAVPCASGNPCGGAGCMGDGG